MWYVEAEREVASRCDGSTGAHGSSLQAASSSSAACLLASEKANAPNVNGRTSMPKWRPRYLAHQIASAAAEEEEGDGKIGNTVGAGASASTMTSTARPDEQSSPCPQPRSDEVDASHRSLEAEDGGAQVDNRTPMTVVHRWHDGAAQSSPRSSRELPSTRPDLSASLMEVADAQNADDEAVVGPPAATHAPLSIPPPPPVPSCVLVPRVHGVNEALLCLLDASELVSAYANHTDAPVSPASSSSPCSAAGAASLPSTMARQTTTSMQTSAAQVVLSDSLAMSSPKSVRRTQRVTRRKVLLLVQALTKQLGAAVQQPIILTLHADSAGGTYMVQLPSPTDESADGGRGTGVVSNDEKRSGRAGRATAPPTPSLTTANTRIADSTDSRTADHTSSSTVLGSANFSPPRASSPHPSTACSSSFAYHTSPTASTTGAAPAAKRKMITIGVFKPRDEEIGQALNPHGNRESDRDAVFRPGTGSRREVLAYCLDHAHVAGVPPTLEVVAQRLSITADKNTPASTSVSDALLSGDRAQKTATTPMHSSPLMTMDTRASGASGSLAESSATATSHARVGSLQSFIPDCVESADVLPGEFDVEEVQAIAIFDIRVLNGDRHGGNILVTPHHPSVMWSRDGQRRPRHRHPRHRRDHERRDTPRTHSEREARDRRTRDGMDTNDVHLNSGLPPSSCSSPPSSASTSPSSSPSLSSLDAEEDAASRLASDEHRRARRPAPRPQRHLIPIDHSYICPSGYADPDFEWLSWPQSKAPFTPRLLDYIKRLDPETDAALVRAALLPPTAMQHTSASHSAFSTSRTSALTMHTGSMWQPSPSTPAALTESVARPLAAISNVNSRDNQDNRNDFSPSSLLSVSSADVVGVSTHSAPTNAQGLAVHTGRSSPPQLPPSLPSMQVALSSSSSSCHSLPPTSAEQKSSNSVRRRGTLPNTSALAATAGRSHSLSVRDAVNRKLKDKRHANATTLASPTSSCPASRSSRPLQINEQWSLAVSACGEAQASRFDTAPHDQPRDNEPPTSGRVAAARASREEEEDEDIQWDDETGDEVGESDDADTAVAAQGSVPTLDLPDGVTGAHAALHRTYSTWRLSSPERTHLQDARVPRSQHHGTHHQATGGMRRARSAVTPPFSQRSPLADEARHSAWSNGREETLTSRLDSRHEKTQHAGTSKRLSQESRCPSLAKPTSPALVVPSSSSSSPPPLLVELSSPPSALMNRREVSFAEFVTDSLGSPRQGLPTIATAHKSDAVAGDSSCVSLPSTYGNDFMSMPPMNSMRSMDLTIDTEAADAAAEMIQCTTILLKVAALEFGMTARQIGELCRRPRITAASFLEETMEAARDAITWQLDMNAFQTAVRARLADAEEDDVSK